MVNNGKTPQNGSRKDWKVFTGDSAKVTVDKMNAAQYADELQHKVKVYDDVKATLDLCRTMIVAIDGTSEKENSDRRMLIESLELAHSLSLLSALSVEDEIRGLGK